MINGAAIHAGSASFSGAAQLGRCRTIATLPATMVIAGAVLTRTDLTGPAALHVLAGVAFAGVGAAASWRRPHNRIGMLLSAAGLAWFIDDLHLITGDAPATVAALEGGLAYGSLRTSASLSPVGAW